MTELAIKANVIFYERPLIVGGHYLYLIEAQNKNGQARALKIGISKKPEDRLQALQVCNYEKLVLADLFRTEKTHQARYLERSMHEKFRSFRAGGEWFSCSKDQVRDALLIHFLHSEEAVNQCKYHPFMFEFYNGKIKA